jgi:NADH-quinone oxidoreductase subunit M
MNWFDSWALTLTILIPAVGAIVVMLIPRAEEEAIKFVALLSTFATFVVTIVIAGRFDYDKGSLLQFDVNKHWIDVINSYYHVAIDGISLPLSCCRLHRCCASSTPGIIFRAVQPEGLPRAKAQILEIGMNGTFIAQDLILFFVFFEIVLLLMFFMIGVWGGPNRQYAPISSSCSRLLARR